MRHEPLMGLGLASGPATVLKTGVSVARFGLIDRSGSPLQAAGSSVTGSSQPQALIQCRQRHHCELRQSMLVIRSRPARQPAAGDAVAARPTMVPFTGLVRVPEPFGDLPPRHLPRHSAYFSACQAVWMQAPAFLN